MNDESMPMPVGSKTRKVCGGCGHRAGQHYPSGCIALVSSSARCGCLIPASDGSATQVDPVAAGRGLDLLALMDERAASAVSPVLAAVLDEAERLRARVAELEAERQATNEWVDDPDCGCCQKGCFDGNVDNPCGHANAPWGAQ
jgi:hypothetical protein